MDCMTQVDIHGWDKVLQINIWDERCRGMENVTSECKTFTHKIIFLSLNPVSTHHNVSDTWSHRKSSCLRDLRNLFSKKDVDFLSYGNPKKPIGIVREYFHKCPCMGCTTVDNCKNCKALTRSLSSEALLSTKWLKNNVTVFFVLLYLTNAEIVILMSEPPEDSLDLVYCYRPQRKVIFSEASVSHSIHGGGGGGEGGVVVTSCLCHGSSRGSSPMWVWSQEG